MTKYDPPAEKYAAGDYMYQSAEMQGLPVYLEDDAPLENTDVVLWYTVGGPPRGAPGGLAGDAMRVHGFFHLKPVGFFDGNPALDFPPSPPKACHHH